MVKPCPGCGVIPVPEARFCRLCGAPLSSGASYDSHAPVSPVAQTMPLVSEGRATEGLSSDDSRPGVSETSRVGRKEMDSILRRVQAEHGTDSRRRSPAPAELETQAPETTTLVPDPVAAPRPPESPDPALSAPPLPAAAPSSNPRARRMWQVAAVALLCVALVAGALAFFLSRKASSSENGTALPISISDQKQLAGEKLLEAETLLAAGEFNHAVDVLRVAVKLDPANAEAHMRLGNALEKSGSRGEAIEEYQAASQKDPNSVSVWRALASAQFEKKLYSDAAESYRRLLVANGDGLDDQTWLEYADALRLAGRTEEARATYQKVSTSSSAEIARSARRHLAEMGQPAVVADGEQQRNARGEPGLEPKAGPASSPTPSAVATPTPAPQNTAAQIDFDSYYFQGLNIVNGRDPRQIERADLLRALGLFQRAAQGGSHRVEAQGYVNRLGREYDRRKKW